MDFVSEKVLAMGKVSGKLLSGPTSIRKKLMLRMARTQFERGSFFPVALLDSKEIVHSAFYTMKKLEKAISFMEKTVQEAIRLGTLDMEPDDPTFKKKGTGIFSITRFFNK